MGTLLTFVASFLKKVPNIPLTRAQRAEARRKHLEFDQEARVLSNLVDPVTSFDTDMAPPSNNNNSAASPAGNPQQTTGAKKPRIEVLTQMTKTAIRKFLWEFERLAGPLDKMINFISFELAQWISHQLASSPLVDNTINNNSAVRAYLENQITELVDNEGLSGLESIEQLLHWPDGGTMADRVKKFIRKIHLFTADIPDLDSIPQRTRINKIIFRRLPRFFMMKEEYADLPQFNTFSKLETALLQRTWAQSLDIQEQLNNKKVSSIAPGPIENRNSPQHKASQQQAENDGFEDFTQHQIQSLMAKVQRLENPQLTPNSAPKVNPTPPVICGYCGGTGHAMVNCLWKKHQDQQNQQNSQMMSMMMLMAARPQAPPHMPYWPMMPQYSPPNPYNNAPQDGNKPKQQPKPKQGNGFPQLGDKPKQNNNSPAEGNYDPAQFGLPSGSKVLDARRSGDANTDVRLFAFTPGNGQYSPIAGCLDTGAFVTAGNLVTYFLNCQTVS